MEQDHFKVSFPLGAKLLISIVSLLLLVILFLTFSTFIVLKEDKTAYTYQSQSLEATMAGKEIAGLAHRAIDSLRLSLATVDPRKPITPDERSRLQNVIDAQSDILSVVIDQIDIEKLTAKTIARASKQEMLKTLEVKEEDLDAAPEWIKIAFPDLKKNAFTFINPSKVGSLPILGVAFADLNLINNSGGLPVAFGFVQLQGFAKEIKRSHLTIATREGWTLFDTDPSLMFSRTNISDDPLFLKALESQTIAGAQEYDRNGERYLGSYIRPGIGLVVVDRIESRKAMSATYSLAEKFFLLGIMAISAAVIFAMFFAKTLTSPLMGLYQATKAVAKGNFDLRVDVKGRDEIGALGGSFNVMASRIRDLIKESMAKVELEGEIKIASTVQQTLIPPPMFSTDRILIQSHYQSATQCGGDWWGFFGVNDKMVLMIADATGHGIASALITSSARSCCSMLHKLAQEDPDFSYSPAAMLSYANRVVHDAASGQLMMTFFVCVIDFSAKTLTYSNAAHNPPWLYSYAGGKYSQKSLISTGQRLGETRDVPTYEEKTVPIDVNDILFLYTDGLPEGKNVAGEQFGKKHVRTVVEENLSEGPEHIISQLIVAYTAHNGDKALDDDITLAVAKITSMGGSNAPG